MKYILLLFLFASVAHAQGVERWPIKTIADGASIDTGITTSTIAEQSALKRPAGSWLTLPRQASESHYIEVAGTLTEYGIEADRDYHLVLSDGGKTMICEIPDPTIPALRHNIHRAEWVSARALIDTIFGKPGKSIKPVKHPRKIVLRGLGFFDRPDHGGGHSINGREIHPVVYVRLN